MPRGCCAVQKSVQRVVHPNREMQGTQDPVRAKFRSVSAAVFNPAMQSGDTRGGK